MGNPAEKYAEPANDEAITIYTLREGMCKWPIGNVSDPDFRFCGKKNNDGPYCTEHHERAVQKRRPRRAENERGLATSADKGRW